MNNEVNIIIATLDSLGEWTVVLNSDLWYRNCISLVFYWPG